MVDINLIGDDQTQYENEENEKDFQDTYSSDANELTQNTYMRGETIDSSEYAKVIRRGGSKAGVFVLFVVVVGLLAVTAYILFKPTSTKQQSQTESPEATQMPVDEGIDTTSLNVASQMETGSDLGSNISLALKENIIKSRQGFDVVNQVVNSIPSKISFTMITYNDGNVLFELLADTESEISDIEAVLRQKVYSANIRILSHDLRYIKGKQYYQALLNGKVDVSSVSGVIQRPQFLTSDELYQRLKVFCEDNGLRIKQFDTGTERNQGDLNVLPITFRAFGIKAGIMNLMQQILAENINVSFVKISLIANEADLQRPYLTLVLNLTLYNNV